MSCFPTPHSADDLPRVSTPGYYVCPAKFDRDGLVCLSCIGEPEIVSDGGEYLETLYVCDDPRCTHSLGLYEKPECHECDVKLGPWWAWLVFRHHKGLTRPTSYLCSECFKHGYPEEYAWARLDRQGLPAERVLSVLAESGLTVEVSK